MSLGVCTYKRLGNRMLFEKEKFSRLNELRLLQRLSENLKTVFLALVTI